MWQKGQEYGFKNNLPVLGQASSVKHVLGKEVFGLFVFS